jgi:hypothetical protein
MERPEAIQHPDRIVAKVFTRFGDLARALRSEMLSHLWKCESGFHAPSLSGGLVRCLCHSRVADARPQVEIAAEPESCAADKGQSESHAVSLIGTGLGFAGAMGSIG